MAGEASQILAFLVGIATVVAAITTLTNYRSNKLAAAKKSQLEALKAEYQRGRVDERNELALVQLRLETRIELLTSERDDARRELRLKGPRPHARKDDDGD